MLAVPFLDASMSIIMRQIRNMSVITISIYSAYAVVISLGIVSYFTSSDVPFYTNFKTTDWIIIFCFGISSSLIQYIRTKAAQHEEAAKIVLVNYSGAVMQLIADLIFFHV
jgi:drug/metabolite transporter (DMT)-like permease